MNKFIKCLNNQEKDYIPIWFMRQAGRHLPEFRKIRKENPNFVNLCFNTKLCTEITLQPISRYDLDAAIIFSDILLIPHVLGQNLEFKKNGPNLSSFSMSKLNLNDPKSFLSKLEPIYKSITEVREKLNDNKAVIGFVGAPWTLIVYMLNLKDNNNLLVKKKYNRSQILEIKEILIRYICSHIKEQFQSGADVIQVFDSWSSLIPESDFEDLSIKANLSIVEFCKENKIPVICFPRGIKEKYKNFVDTVKPNCINIDYEVDPEWAYENLKDVSIQGGLNPNKLLLDTKVVIKEVEKYIKIFSNRPYIFNLGHGLLPKTNPEILNKVIEKVRVNI